MLEGINTGSLDKLILKEKIEFYSMWYKMKPWTIDEVKSNKAQLSFIRNLNCSSKEAFEAFTENHISNLVR